MGGRGGEERERDRDRERLTDTDRQERIGSLLSQGFRTHFLHDLYQSKQGGCQKLKPTLFADSFPSQTNTQNPSNRTCAMATTLLVPSPLSNSRLGRGSGSHTHFKNDLPIQKLLETSEQSDPRPGLIYKIK